jgi:hypothetical protein
MEELFVAYGTFSFITALWLWHRGNKWHKAFLNKPVQRIVQAPKPKPTPPKVSTPPKPKPKLNSDLEKAIQLAKRMERIGGRSPEQKKEYMMKKLLRPGHLSVDQAERLIREAYGLLR